MSNDNMTMDNAKSRQAGFTFVEIAFALALVAIFSVGTMALFRTSLLAGGRAKRTLQAKLLAQEGMEAVIAVRDANGSDWDWSSTPEKTGPGEYYQPEISGNKWSLGPKMSSSPPPPLPAPYQDFTRTVQIKSVQRAVGCGQTICPIVDSGGAVDSGTVKVEVSVSWQEEGETRTINLSSYLTRWR